MRGAAGKSPTDGFPSQPCSITNMFRVGAIRHSFTSQKAAQYVGELSILCFRLGSRLNLLLKGCKETRRQMARERRGAISSSVNTSSTARGGGGSFRIGNL